jgi:hypothetical protein
MNLRQSIKYPLKKAPSKCSGSNAIKHRKDEKGHKIPTNAENA